MPPIQPSSAADPVLRPGLCRSAALLALGSLFYIAWAADTGRMPSWMRLLYDFPQGDRVGHVLVYGTLAFLLHLAFPWTWTRSGRAIPVAVSLLALLGTAEEASQAWFPNRTPDPVDLFCTGVGILLGHRLARRVVRRSARDPDHSRSRHPGADRSAAPM